MFSAPFPDLFRNNETPCGVIYYYVSRIAAVNVKMSYLQIKLILEQAEVVPSSCTDFDIPTQVLGRMYGQTGVREP